MDYVNVKTINGKNTYFAPRLLEINIDNSPFGQKTINIGIDYKLVKFNK